MRELVAHRFFKLNLHLPRRGRERDAKPGEREMGVQLAKQLKDMIAPYFLRRTKAEVFRSGTGPKIEVSRTLSSTVTQCSGNCTGNGRESGDVEHLHFQIEPSLAGRERRSCFVDLSLGMSARALPRLPAVGRCQGHPSHFEVAPRAAQYFEEDL